MKILLIEDDFGIGSSLQRFLTESGEFCRWTTDGLEALELARSQEHDVIVLDLLLPGCNGIQLVQTVRQEKILTPIIVLTALGTVEQRVFGLEAGADDYLVKPFAMTELLARVRALSRRSLARPSPVIEVDDVRLDLSTREATRAGVAIDLTPTEMSLLEFLMRHSGQLVTRKMISSHLWDADMEYSSNVVDVHVKRLRSKLDRDFPTSMIQTIRGRGYVFRNN